MKLNYGIMINAYVPLYFWVKVSAHQVQMLVNSIWRDVCTVNNNINNSFYSCHLGVDVPRAKKKKSKSKDSDSSSSSRKSSTDSNDNDDVTKAGFILDIFLYPSILAKFQIFFVPPISINKISFHKIILLILILIL